MVTWNRVTRADVLRAIKDYDRLGPERFFSVSPPRRSRAAVALTKASYSLGCR